MTQHTPATTRPLIAITQDKRQGKCIGCGEHERHVESALQGAGGSQHPCLRCFDAAWASLGEPAKAQGVLQ